MEYGLWYPKCQYSALSTNNICWPTGRPNKPQGHQQTMLNMLNFLCLSGEIVRLYVNLTAARTAPIPICQPLFGAWTNVYRSVADFILLHRPVEWTLSQSAQPHCLNVYLQLQILAALLKLSAVLNICCTHSAAEPLSFSI